MSWLSRITGDPNQKEINRHQIFVEKVNALEPEVEKLDDNQIRDISLELKKKVTALADEIMLETRSIADRHEQNRARKDKFSAILEEDKAYAFALVREMAKRKLGQRHFDVQIIGGSVLHEGKIAEMKTGEGKTIVASLALYLNALTGQGAHLVTVNDYLARLGAGWMGPIYHALGMSLAVIGPEFSGLYDPEYSSGESDWRLERFRPITRQEAYRADILYATNNELGFDYLRDNMAQKIEQVVQTELTYAIIDEVDSILIDEARTPLIISAPSAQSAEAYAHFASHVKRLKKDIDFTVDEKMRAVSLTSEGMTKIERLAGVTNLYDPTNVALVHYLDESLKAYALYAKNKDYVVKDGEVLIVDEFTGRILTGRRYSGGLHQAIEAKEGVLVKEESVTLATITFQNYFRLYSKMAGMTGTALTEAEELSKIYDLEVVAIPPNRPVVRQDWEDEIYRTEEGKFQAVVSLVKELHQKGQPVLIGTVSISKSERLAKMLKAAGLKHAVLNAKFHQKEGEIVSRAGQPGAITVATNMAGRGVDIILGGPSPTENSTKDEVKEWEKQHESIIELGGLFVIGTERHESRRIDNQLRGRAGRQGDPGESRFFLSLEDDLMRIFGGERMKSLMERLNIPEDMSIKNKLISRAIEQSQVRVEGYNFDSRKQLLEYDDVINKHRETIYRRRSRVLAINSKEDADNLHQELLDSMNESEREAYEAKSAGWTEEIRRQVEQYVVLRTIDTYWVEHLETMDQLKESIGLRGYGQREPIVEYKQEAYGLFTRLQETLTKSINEMLQHVNVEQGPVAQSSGTTKMMEAQTKRADTKERGKIGRNDPCPCGATKPDGHPIKYKHCHGK